MKKSLFQGFSKSNLVILFTSIFFSTIAYADATLAHSPSMISNIVMVVGFLAIFYFMLIRPQSKRAKEQQALLSGIAKGDEVITSGGLLGKVLKVSDQFLVLVIADGIEVKVQKHAVTASLPKGTMENI